MTEMTGMTGPACREIRQLLGVYVVGAIDPAERAVVEDHLEHCRDCREELSGLAGLPALLRRVPVADAERLSATELGLNDLDEPPAELLDGLLRRVTARRRSRRWRSVLALAAAVAVAAGGTAAVIEASQPATPAASSAMAQASNATVTAQIRYVGTPWGGSTMRVGVMGIRTGTTCRFWVVNAAGQRSAAGSWTIGPGYGEQWYAVSSPVAAGQVHGFAITSQGKTLLSVPAS
jgi:anti-sigma-K factor RskA